jgi:hypothetical protein
MWRVVKHVLGLNLIPIPVLQPGAIHAGRWSWPAKWDQTRKPIRAAFACSWSEEGPVPACARKWCGVEMDRELGQFGTEMQGWASRRPFLLHIAKGEFTGHMRPHAAFSHGCNGNVIFGSEVLYSSQALLNLSKRAFVWLCHNRDSIKAPQTATSHLHYHWTEQFSGRCVVRFMEIKIV